MPFGEDRDDCILTFRLCYDDIVIELFWQAVDSFAGSGRNQRKNIPPQASTVSTKVSRLEGGLLHSLILVTACYAQAVAVTSGGWHGHISLFIRRRPPYCQRVPESGRPINSLSRLNQLPRDFTNCSDTKRDWLFGYPPNQWKEMRTKWKESA